MIEENHFKQVFFTLLDDYWKPDLNIENQIYLNILNNQNEKNDFESMLWSILI